LWRSEDTHFLQHLPNLLKTSPNLWHPTCSLYHQSREDPPMVVVILAFAVVALFVLSLISPFLSRSNRRS